jgi:predicted dehydrogenase
MYGTLVLDENGNTTRETIQTLRGDYNLYFDAVASSIRQQIAPPISPVENLLVIKILEAAYQSNDENRVVII